MLILSDIAYVIAALFVVAAAQDRRTSSSILLPSFFGIGGLQTMLTQDRRSMMTGNQAVLSLAVIVNGHGLLPAEANIIPQKN